MPLSSTDHRVFEYVEKHPHSSCLVIAHQTGLPLRSIEHAIRLLLQLRKVEQSVRGEPRRYSLTHAEQSKGYKELDTTSGLYW